MNKIEMGDTKLGAGGLAMLLVIAYAFSIAIRFIWVYQMGDVDSYYWHGQLMINTNDGYFFGSGAQKELFGTLQENPRVPDWLRYGVVFFTTLTAKYTPFSLETVMLYLPAVISSIVVVPIILIGRLYGSALFGFFAALIGSIAWSYYNRTMVGYYDTDMFSAMMPMFILYFLLAMLETEKPIYILFAALTIIVYPFLYDQGLSLVYAMGLLYMGYMVLFHRRDRYTYESIILVAIALMGMPVWLKLIMVVGLYFVFTRTELERKNLMIAAGIAVVLFLIFGNVFGLIYAKVSGYLFRGVEAGSGLHFYEVAQTVREAGRIPFETMANRISGSIPGVIAALIGYILLVIRHRGFILALPLIGIGVFSLWGGLRFTVYAVPVAAISAVYLFYFIAKYIENSYGKLAVVAGLTAAMLYPNITHVIGYKVPTVFTKYEVASLDRLAKIGSEKDYVLTWWDYGYPIWFYGDKNTLIDGGKHNHDNFIVSEMLTTDSQLEAARLARISVETYVASGYKIVADTLFKNAQPDQLDPNAYLESLKYADMDMPKPTRDVYLFLPLRMLDIFPTISAFSNLDLNSGQQYRRPFFYGTTRYGDAKEYLDLGRGFMLNKRTGMMRVGSQEIPLRSFYTLRVRKDGTVETKNSLVHMNGTLSLVYMASYGKFLLLDDKMLRSNYIQMFVFGNYDHKLFELVENGPFVKIYKLKI